MKQSVTQEQANDAWLISLAAGQIILENQGLLEDSDKFKQSLKNTTSRFINEVERAMSPDINACFKVGESTTQEIIKGIEKLCKVAARMDPVELNQLTKFIEKKILANG